MEPNTTGSAGALSNTSTSSQTGGVKQELASDAKTIGDAARGKVEQKAAAGKEQVTEAARNTSSALNKAVDALRQDGDTPQWLTKAFESGARELDRLAGSFEGKDMRAITQDVTEFARRSPVAFLGAAAAIGFVAARFLRAGSEYGAHQADGGMDSGSGSTGSTAQGYATQDFGGQNLGGQSSDGYPVYGNDADEDRSTFAFDSDTGGASGSYEGTVR
ncbi:hypothetical protein [Qipengyuania sediminis]|uniref:hypothetical protein n=1 Tax=Qipengyuania sediminis TaxID=1532023 RepID=UPI0014049B6F|nr:hypothetical protein [Qipengyuania sediminis]